MNMTDVVDNIEGIVFIIGDLNGSVGLIDYDIENVRKNETIMEKW